MEGEPSGINCIYRLYSEEGLTVRKRKARRKALGTRAPILIEARANGRWSLDFVHDQFACGRRFRVLNVVDDFTRECLAAILDTSISRRSVVRELTALIERRGDPRRLRPSAPATGLCAGCGKSCMPPENLGATRSPAAGVAFVTAIPEGLPVERKCD